MFTVSGDVLFFLFTEVLHTQTRVHTGMRAHTNTRTHWNMVNVWLSIRGSHWVIRPGGFICGVAPSSGHPVYRIPEPDFSSTTCSQLSDLIQSPFSEYQQCSIRSAATPDLSPHAPSSAVTRRRARWQQAQQWFVCPNWGRRWTPANVSLCFTAKCAHARLRVPQSSRHPALTSAVNPGDNNVDVR